MYKENNNGLHSKYKKDVLEKSVNYVENTLCSVVEALFHLKTVVNQSIKVQELEMFESLEAV